MWFGRVLYYRYDAIFWMTKDDTNMNDIFQVCSNEVVWNKRIHWASLGLGLCMKSQSQQTEKETAEHYTAADK